jgi:DNA-binding IclR family transcriptional regulator
MTSLDRGLSVLDRFRERPDWGVSELARATGMDKAAVHRTLQVLKRHGWVRQDPATRRYAIGPAAAALAGRGLPRATLVAAARPVLEDLVARFGETAVLLTRADLAAQVELVVQPEREMRVVSQVGRHIPLHCGAGGKALLSAAEDHALDRLAAAGPAFTARTITGAAALRREVAAIRRRGWSLEDGEYSEDVRGVGVPVADAFGAVVAAIALRAPAARLADGALPEVAAALGAAARRLGRALAA